MQHDLERREYFGSSAALHSYLHSMVLFAQGLMQGLITKIPEMRYKRNQRIYNYTVNSYFILLKDPETSGFLY
jgi:hypothetical protein